jgi:hypothetical protein
MLFCRCFKEGNLAGYNEMEFSLECILVFTRAFDDVGIGYVLKDKSFVNLWAAQPRI